MAEPTPTRDDKFTFGLWTVGWQAKEPFGDPTRDPIDPVETVHRLSGLGRAGARGYGYVRLDHFATEHRFGAR